MSPVFFQYPVAPAPFHEAEFIYHINNMFRMKKELDGLAKRVMWMVPGGKQTRYFPSSYYLSAFTLSHILDRHYHKVPRHPEKSKFTIPIPEIVKYIRMAFPQPTGPLIGHCRERILPTGLTIGWNEEQEPCQSIKVVSDLYGNIRTAYPI
ncbi:MAG: hypothetical protein J7527_09670 [Chitinophagaceae bacterium]|nr:hypothetical protein [Chitinophagaceae bacterium]